MSDVKLYHGDCLTVMKGMADKSVDAAITDPPYHLMSIVKRFGKKDSAPAQFGTDGRFVRASRGFMGKEWDGGDIAFRPETWEAVLRVMKPGAMLLAFGGTRTYHRLTCAIEDAGFEIRDCIFWIYGSGFPKSHDISKGMDKRSGVERKIIGVKPGHEGFAGRGNMSSVQSLKGTLGGDGGFARPWMDDPEAVERYHQRTAPTTDLAKQWDGWGTALKPACEPIVVAMRPLEGTFAQNAERWGVAGLNIDGARISTGDTYSYSRKGGSPIHGGGENVEVSANSNPKGRWPANVILDEDAAQVLDEQSGVKSGGFVRNRTNGARPFNNDGKPTRYETIDRINEPPCGASRFFYVAKASRSERNAGLEGMGAKKRDASRDASQPSMNGGEGNPYNRGAMPITNHHPTVKPLALMRYLCKLTATPTGGIVLDPFMGSGTTGIATVMEGRDFIGIELEKDYYDIAAKRIADAQKQIRMEI